MSEKTFEAYRPLLFSIAYRMLGSAMDAEDLVQETWLRYQDVDQGKIESPKAYLSTIVTRLSINRLNSARMQRESYIGPWLPEPLLTDGSTPARQIDRYEAISMALLVVLERLTAAERAVFLLREVFDFEYEEIAAILDKSEVACRKLFSRARQHVMSHRPRFESSSATHEQLVHSFLKAAKAGDMQGLKELLAEDVVVWTDGGGQVVAARRPIRGRESAARFILNTRRFAPSPFTGEVASVNGEAAVILRAQSGRAFLVITMQSAGDHIQTFHIVGNPEKLQQL